MISTIAAPPIRIPISKPTTVTTGISAFRSACRETTSRALHALRARGAHVVLAQHLEHRRAHHPHHDREREDRDRDRRQDELAQVLDRVLVERDVRERRHPAEDARGEEQEQRREPEVRDADPDEAADARGVVVPLSRLARPRGRRAGCRSATAIRSAEEDQLERDRQRASSRIVRDRLGVAVARSRSRRGRCR